MLLEKNQYAQSGVSSERSEKFLEYLKCQLKIFSGIQKNNHTLGGFCALYEKDDHSYWAATTDGIGSKLLLANELKYFSSLGQDLVAMNVNDLICSGARPLFFLDYLACHQLDPYWYEPFVDGLVKALTACRLILLGGETSEMPSMFAPGVFDVAGFCVGEVEKKDVINGCHLKDGDLLVALRSSGYHANGFSLIRSHGLFFSDQQKRELLTPTILYAPLISLLLKENPHVLKAMANITGGGIRNIPRMSDQWCYLVDDWWEEEEYPEVYQQTKIVWESLPFRERFETFNMGTGFVVAVDPKHMEMVRSFFEHHGILTKKIGHVISRDRKHMISEEGILTMRYKQEHFVFSSKV
jgi:phosphoribosylformylglycinamidine cyclo-ligase